MIGWTAFGLTGRKKDPLQMKKRMEQEAGSVAGLKLAGHLEGE